MSAGHFEPDSGPLGNAKPMDAVPKHPCTSESEFTILKDSNLGKFQLIAHHKSGRLLLGDLTSSASHRVVTIGCTSIRGADAIAALRDLCIAALTIPHGAE